MRVTARISEVQKVVEGNRTERQLEVSELQGARTVTWSGAEATAIVQLRGQIQ